MEATPWIARTAGVGRSIKRAPAVVRLGRQLAKVRDLIAMTARLLITGVLLWLWIDTAVEAGIPDVWTIRSSPSSNQLNGVAYGNGVFVAVGNQATILTSLNGRDWTARSVGTTAPTIWSAAYGKGRYVISGGEGALIRSSTDVINWTNGLSTTGAESINAVAYGNGFFVAVGRGQQINTSYILTSSNGLDWISRNVPTTNTLFGISPDFGANGVGWAEDLLVAVGDRGTIITSTNGANWVVRNSGTTVTLRAVLFHRGMIVLGDSGIVLGSSDGASWSVAAPVSFNVRGAASSGDAIVAVGNYLTEGRLHASTDGFGWFGLSTGFPQRLNAIAYGAGSFVAVGDGGLIIQSGATNEWTKPASGVWQELDYWSLRQLPAINQDLVAFRNPGFKALAINSSTTSHYSNSLAINALTVDAPAGSFNQLLLNYAGLDVPLSVASDFILGVNGSLVSYYSALQGGNLYLSGPATFSESSTIAFGKIELEVAAALNLTNSSLAADLLILGPSATVGQDGGSSQVSSLQMYAGSAYSLNNGTFIANSVDLQSLAGTGLAQFTVSGGCMDVQGLLRLGQPKWVPDAQGEFLLERGYLRCAEMDFLNGTFAQTGGTNFTARIALPLLDNSRGDYLLSGGMLISSNVSLGAVLSPATPSGSANLAQSGGVHSNLTMGLFGEIRRGFVTHYGSYSLSGGLLVSDAIRLLSGAFIQSGGTNHTRELVLDEAGSFVLSSGQLVTSNTTVDTAACVMSDFIQNGGSHTVQNRLLLQDFVRYELRAGTLTARNFDIGPGSELRLQGGAISNTGLFTIRGGGVRASGQTQQLGQLQVVGEAVSVCNSSQPAASTLDVGFSSGTGATLVRFQDSRDVDWSGAPLSILNWSPSTNGFGPDHIIVGANAQGLTTSQLSKLVFVNPFGWPSGDYPARMLPTGEIVPGVPPPLGFTRTSNSLTLSWSGDYELVTATNLTGPYIPVAGASSPLTHTFTDPQRYFRLR